MQLTSSTMKHSTRGFSLVEMLVALLVISIGLLGIAKMQALALSNTSGGRLRAVAAIEAGGLASLIASNHNYWGTLASALTITVTAGSSAATITSSDSTLSTTVNCLYGSGSAAPCTAAKMAGYDLQQWVAEFQNVMNGVGAANYFASVSCNALTSGTTQVTCQITVNWTEQNVNALANTSQSAASMASPSYTLFVSP
jgi:type IV pilus assembly protein PilV